MPAISFSGAPSRGPFYQQILDGEKTVTTRKQRKHPIKRGDNLVLYWKQRQPIDSKPIHKIGDAYCERVLTFKNMASLIKSLGVKGLTSYIKGEGFADLRELVNWWTGRDPSGYGILSGGVLLDQESWEILESTGPVQTIEFTIDCAALRRDKE